MSNAIKTLLALMDQYPVQDQWSTPEGGVTLMLRGISADEVRRHVQRAATAGDFRHQGCYLVDDAQVRVDATRNNVFVTAEPVH